MTDRLADAIRAALTDPETIPWESDVAAASAAVHALLATALAEEEARWVAVSDESSEGVYAVLNLRVALGVTTTNEAVIG